MGKNGGYLSKALRGADNALRSGVKAADGVIDKAADVGTTAGKRAVDVGTTAGKRAVDAGKDASGQARRLVGAKGDVEMLERLGNMWREGMLTDEEFRAAKARILARL